MGFASENPRAVPQPVDRYRFSYRWFPIVTSKHSTQVSIGGASRRMSDASLCHKGRGRARGND